MSRSTRGIRLIMPPIQIKTQSSNQMSKFRKKLFLQYTEKHTGIHDSQNLQNFLRNCRSFPDFVIKLDAALTNKENS